MFDLIGGKAKIEEIKATEEPVEVIKDKKVFRVTTEKGDFAVIVKQIYKSFEETPKLELEQRKLSITIFETKLPNLAIANEIDLLSEDADIFETARVSPWINETTPFSDLSLINILTDPLKLTAIVEVANFCINQLENNGRRFDFLKGPEFKSLPESVRAILRVIKNINLFEGIDQNGNKIIFADSDWFSIIEAESPMAKHALKTWERTAIIAGFLITMANKLKR